MSRRIYTEIINPNGNFLFTVDDLNNVTNGTIKCLPCKCLQCGKIFYISRHNYQQTLAKGKPVTYKCCSYECAKKFKINKKQVFCSYCGKPILRTPSHLSKHNFCSSSCAAKFNNKGRILSKETRKKQSKSLIKFYSNIQTKLPCFSSKFKTCFHTTWEGKIFFCRSSLELDYCLVLDKQKISYDMETLRIPYFSTRKNRIAVAIPDFYLPDSNTIVEIKSSFTYSQQDMLDRSTEYKRLGYNFKLVIDQTEYTSCPKNLRAKTIFDYDTNII